MGSRIRDNVRHFFECFCEVVPKSGTKEPWIIQKFPEGYKDQEVMKSVTSFAYPCEFENVSVQHYSFVLTNIDSKWTFGFCRHDPKTETALVVLSYLPWHSAFQQFLNNIAVLTQSPKSEELWDFLSAAYNSPVPEPGFNYQVTFNNGLSTFSCQSPSQFQLPSIPENRNLTEYYNAVDSHNMMVIFASMLYERRIIFTSKKLYRLSACVQSANDIIYPMIWQHIFIPVLPMSFKDYLLAPMPFLIGVPDTVLKNVRKVDIGEVVILDADANVVETPFDDLESLPQEIVSSLKRQLRNRSTLLGDGVSRAFLRALVQLIGGYRDALRFQPGEKITFSPEAFIESRSASMQPFLKKMLQLQIFQQFIEERLQMLNSGLGFSDEFECEACNYSEKSSSKLKQQYKEFIKSVKDKANPAVKSAVKSVKEGGKGMRSAYKGLKSRFRESQSPEDPGYYGEAPQYSLPENNKPKSAPNSPPTSRRKPIAKTTYRKVPLHGLKPIGEGRNPLSTRNPAYSPLSPPSNPGSPDSPEHEPENSFAPMHMDLLREMQEVLYRRQMDTDDGDHTPPVDRSLKPVRSLESFKQAGRQAVHDKPNCTEGWWGTYGGDTKHNRLFPESHSATQNLLDSFESPTCNTYESSTLLDTNIPSIFDDTSKLFHSNLSKSFDSSKSHHFLDSAESQLFDSVDDVFASPPIPPRRPSFSGKDLFGAAPFVVSGVQCENGDPVFLIASPNSVDMVKLSPPPSISYTTPVKLKQDKNNDDLIRLDSTPSDGIDDFDPLLSKDRHQPSNVSTPAPSTSQHTTEIGLSNPLYSYFLPPKAPTTASSSSTPHKKAPSRQFHETTNHEQDLLQEYGLNFTNFSLNIQNGDSVKSKDPFDPFEQSSEPIPSKKQWTKFE